MAAWRRGLTEGDRANERAPQPVRPPLGQTASVEEADVLSDVSLVAVENLRQLGDGRFAPVTEKLECSVRAGGLTFPGTELSPGCRAWLVGAKEGLQVTRSHRPPIAVPLCTEASVADHQVDG